MGRRWLSSKPLAGVVSVVAVLVWAVAGAAAAVSFERMVTVPYCRDACLAAGDELEVYRTYRRSGPPQACVCHSGKEIRPGFWRNPVGVTLFTLVFVPAVAFFAWANVHDARVAAERKLRQPNHQKRHPS